MLYRLSVSDRYIQSLNIKFNILAYLNIFRQRMIERYTYFTYTNFRDLDIFNTSTQMIRIIMIRPFDRKSLLFRTHDIFRK